MSGILYGVGVGPGDPELMTLKAVRLIKENDIIAVPGADVRETVAYKIAVQAVPELADKELLPIYMPMTHDKAELELNHEKGAKALEAALDTGKNVVFLTLGDPTIYSTYMYIHRIVKAKGYETTIISGIPSFCAAAARMDDSLVDRAEELHVIPSSYGIEAALNYSGTKILMKSASGISEVKRTLEEKDGNVNVKMIENCGMPEERIYERIEDVPEQAGYYSLLIVKESEKER